VVLAADVGTELGVECGVELDDSGMELDPPEPLPELEPDPEEPEDPDPLLPDAIAFDEISTLNRKATSGVPHAIRLPRLVMAHHHVNVRTNAQPACDSRLQFAERSR
jgi:hypothetical protein